jgi:hypothetical protein
MQVEDAEVAVLTTYKIQMDWLLDRCPSLLKIPEVVIAHGDIVLVLNSLGSSAEICLIFIFRILCRIIFN